MLYSLFAFLLGTGLGVSAQTIQQWPASKVQPVGSPLSLECTVEGTSNPNLYWYWQATGGTLQQIFYSFGMGKVESVVPRNLSASRPKDGQFFLRAEKVLLSHSGFYLCAWSLTLSGLGQTSVQKPHPLPLLGTLPKDGWRGFVTEFLAASQVEVWNNTMIQVRTL